MRKIQKEKSEDTFFISWGDLVSLLLVFFIYLFSISEIDPIKFLEVGQSMEKEITDNVNISKSRLEKLKEEKEELERMQSQMESYIEENNLQDVFSVEYLQDRVEMNLGNVLLFEVGKAALKTKAKDILMKVNEVLESANSLVIVEGHTDDVVIKSDKYPSNWELSSARAAAVVRFLVEKGIPGDRCKVIGMSKYQPLAPNTSIQNRSKNRRVKITLKPNVE